MATAARTSRALQTSVSVAAGGSRDSSVWTAGGALSGFLVVHVVNGATGPTVGALVTCYVSDDGTRWRALQPYRCPTTANAEASIPFDLPIGTMYAYSNVSGHTGQAVTTDTYLQELSSVS